MISLTSPTRTHIDRYKHIESILTNIHRNAEGSYFSEQLHINRNDLSKTYEKCNR